MELLMRRTVLSVLITSVLAFAHSGTAQAGGGGGGGGGGMGPCTATSSGARLRLQDYCIDGVAHFADVGSTLVVTNEGQHAHSLTAADGSFDTGLLAPGGSAEIVLNEAGIIIVYCKPHGVPDGHGMAGLLIVGDPDPAALGAAGPGRSISSELSQHDQATVQALAEQSQRLEAVDAQLTRLQNWLRAAAWGLAGVLILASGLLLTSRRRPASAASD